MITRANGLIYAKLIHVSIENGKTKQSNKYYILDEQPNGIFRVEYGRIGCNHPAVETYPISMWDKKYNEKTSSHKGYVDNTNLFIETVIDSFTPTTIDIKVPTIKKLFDELKAFANHSIQRNYKVTQENVTEVMINEAQSLIDQLSKMCKIGVNLNQINTILIRLYTVIPRKMKDVRNHLFLTINDKNSLEQARNLIKNEQDTLDIMAGQVQLIKQQRESVVKTASKGSSSSITLLEQLGLIVEEATAKEVDMVRKMMGNESGLMKRVFKVINKTTQNKFNNYVEHANNKSTELFWHGSRNENWFNIIQTGLLIRPSGAIHTGSMFGDAIYMADKFLKSYGYTSGRNSYWARGSSNVAYLALFTCHTGKQKHIYKYDSFCCSLNEQKIKAEGYDSVFAHNGADLRNNEYCFYNSSQVTISYLVEINS
jgi:poly [ADP-ribose] polymerase